MKPAKHLFAKVRRAMIAGLVLSTLGNRVVEYGFQALTAADVVPVLALVVISSLGHAVVFFYPLYAKILGRFSPDKALAATDAAEGAFSVLTCLWIIVFPQQAVHAVIIYLLIDLLLAPVTDIAEEYYGAHFAQVDEDTALAFNASLYSMLAISGFIVGGLAGSFLAGLSILVLMAANTVLSFAGAGLRYTARHLYPVPPPDEVEAEDYSALGQQVPLKQFMHDMLRSGPASPLISAALALTGTMTGELFLLWVASQGVAGVHIPGVGAGAFTGMGLTLAVFGVGAAIGPHIGKYLKRFTHTEYTLRLLAVLSVVITGALALWIGVGTVPAAVLLLFTLLIAALSRARMIVLDTHRQAYFKGKQFARIMSWSFAFSAVGTVAGLQVGYWLNQANNPVPCLIIGTILWVVITPVVSSTRTPHAPVGTATDGTGT